MVAEGDRIKTRMKEFGERDFEGQSFANLKSIVDIVTENQLKTMKGIKKLSDDQKEDLVSEYNTRNPASAYRKANKEIEELRKIASDLHGVGITLHQIDTHLGGASTAGRSGAVVDKTIVSGIKAEAKRQMATLDSTIAATARTGAPTVDMREHREKIRELIEHVDKLQDSPWRCPSKHRRRKRRG